MYNRYLRNDDGVYTRMPMQDAPRGEPPRDGRPPDSKKWPTTKKVAFALCFFNALNGSMITS